ncbi:MAG: FISUMP domain-containing protein [Chitinophagales bacterium]|nr:hypothetical protein [Bacteroidota bacterium]MCB9042161.1 hypothetical protein [Chitinophagales bacterium]
MKKLLVLVASFFISLPSAQAQSVGINTNVPHPSAMLEIQSNNQGMLPPRLSAQERDAILNPATGLMIYCTTSNCLNYFDGSEWKELCGNTAPTAHICGQDFVDIRDGEIYTTVEIGGVCWLAENLRYNPGNNVYAGTGSYAPDSVGLYYNWNGALQGALTQNGVPGTIQGSCPIGWHVPTKDELTNLNTAVGGSSNALKREDQGSGAGQGTNTSGFGAILAGYYIPLYGLLNTGTTNYFWSTTEYSLTAQAYVRFMNDNSDFFIETQQQKMTYLPVRCIRNE